MISSSNIPPKQQRSRKEEVRSQELEVRIKRPVGAGLRACLKKPFSFLFPLLDRVRVRVRVIESTFKPLIF
jgi:hypothetical protein